MYILVDDVYILASGDNIEFGVYDEPTEKWKVTKGECSFYVLSDTCKVYEVENVPNDVDSGKYCYNETDGFYPNPDYVEPFDIDAEVKRLKTENEELKTTVSNLENNTVESEIETDFRLSMLELGLA